MPLAAAIQPSGSRRTSGYLSHPAEMRLEEDAACDTNAMAPSSSLLQ
ncbi:MAG: hypothetical protein AVDCRST_MAG93-6181 [uncultured Chloroflexia bacterium]|uniref:Uncharacterized protein n=1 Tax=uncultured Chloroflexia bacterium TaxID=1672391 RepID=A0A6J4LDM3_9CHLR|nr:MAG: hypothetical protein AVDCRST_MAG93-6181 [uncultured Chloroflexia bacterium]